MKTKPAISKQSAKLKKTMSWTRFSADAWHGSTTQNAIMLSLVRHQVCLEGSFLLQRTTSNVEIGPKKRWETSSSEVAERRRRFCFSPLACCQLRYEAALVARRGVQRSTVSHVEHFRHTNLSARIADGKRKHGQCMIDTLAWSTTYRTNNPKHSLRQFIMHVAHVINDLSSSSCAQTQQGSAEVHEDPSACSTNKACLRHGDRQHVVKSGRPLQTHLSPRDVASTPGRCTLRASSIATPTSASTRERSRPWKWMRGHVLGNDIHEISRPTRAPPDQTSASTQIFSV